MSLDATDLHILNALQANARVSNTEIARELGMAPSAILERIRKLEKSGVIVGYEARVAPGEVGLGLTAFIFVRSSEPRGAPTTQQHLVACPHVLEVHHVAGDDCFLVKVRVRDTGALAQLLEDDIKSIPHLASTRTTIVLSTEKETNRLALPRGESTSHRA